MISTKIFWGGKGVNDKGLSRKHIIEGMQVCFLAKLERHPLHLQDSFAVTWLSCSVVRACDLEHVTSSSVFCLKPSQAHLA